MRFCHWFHYNHHYLIWKKKTMLTFDLILEICFQFSFFLTACTWMKMLISSLMTLGETWWYFFGMIVSYSMLNAAFWFLLCWNVWFMNYSKRIQMISSSTLAFWSKKLKHSKKATVLYYLLLIDELMMRMIGDFDDWWWSSKEFTIIYFEFSKKNHTGTVQ